VSKDSDHSGLFDSHSRPAESEQFVTLVMEKLREEDSVWSFLPEVRDWLGAFALGMLCFLVFSSSFLPGFLPEESEEILLASDFEQYDIFESIELGIEPELLIFEDFQ